MRELAVGAEWTMIGQEAEGNSEQLADAAVIEGTKVRRLKTSARVGERRQEEMWKPEEPPSISPPRI